MNMKQQAKRKRLLKAIMVSVGVDTQSALAVEMGITQGHLWQWFFRNRVFPTRAAILIDELTHQEFPKHLFRPDIWPPPPKTNTPERLNG